MQLVGESKCSPSFLWINVKVSSSLVITKSSSSLQAVLLKRDRIVKSYNNSKQLKSKNLLNIVLHGNILHFTYDGQS